MIGKASAALVAYSNTYELGCRPVEESAESRHGFRCLPPKSRDQLSNWGGKGAIRTMDKAALVDRMVGLGRGAFGTGGGRAATWGDAASADTTSPEGTTTGGEGCWGERCCLVFGKVEVWEWGPERADIMAWRCKVKARGERRVDERDERASEDNMTVERDDIRDRPHSVIRMTNHHIDISTDVHWLSELH